MAYTLIFTGESETKRAELISELTVGRTDQNDVVLNTDQGVSRRHCRFFIGDDSQIYVEDLGSANGVQINGALIEPSKPVRFSTGQEITVGKTKVTIAAAESRRPSPRESSAVSQGLALRDSPRRRSSRTRGNETRGDELAFGESDSDVAPVEPAPAGRGGRRSGPKASKAVKATSRGKLRCVGGPAEGEVFDLNGKPRIIIGRVAPADIILKNMSVGRKHAEIYKVGSCFNISDLGTPSGTKVNGEPVTDTQLCPGDEVVIGEYTFEYTGPGEARSTNNGSKSKVIVGVIILLIAVFTAFVAMDEEEVEYQETPMHRAKPMSGVSKDDDQVDPLVLLGRCKALADVEGEQLNFQEAQKVCDRVLELDPSLTEARTLSRLAANELKFGKFLEDAKLKSSTSQDEAAIEILLKIDPGSMTFTQARQVFSETTERLTKRLKTQCLSDTSSGYYKQAYESCQRYRELTCNTQDDDAKVVSNFNLAARKTKSSNTFVCPDKYKVFGTRIVYDASGIEKSITRMYSSAIVGKLMVEYYNTGRPKKIADDLKRAKAKNPRAFDRSVDDLILSLDVIDGRYTSGQEGVLRKDASAAEAYWKDAFEAESKILPEGINSSLVRDMKGQLSKIYFNNGEESFKKEHYAEAFSAYYKGYLYDARNREILEKIAWLEQRASKLLRENDCGSAQLAVDITIPKSGINKRAKDKMEELNCY